MAVQEIIKLKKSDLLTLEKKLEFKRNGRPVPELKLIQTTKHKGKDVNRHFKQSMYELCEWICGCEIGNALFCYPCLLFYGESLWTKAGVKDIKHLKEKIKNHGDSTIHINSSVSFASLGGLDINSAYRKSFIEFNEQVKQNRYTVNKLIDCVKFCGIFERGHNEIDISDEFRGLIDFVLELDSVFTHHYENSTVFNCISKTDLQNDILDSMLAIIHKTIIDEIEQANFLAIIADEITDSSNKIQIVFLVRYFFKGKIHERFWKLINPLDTIMNHLTDVILEELATLKISDKPEKLVAQSYDGAIIKSGHLGGVQSKIKHMYPNANFVHCYAHQINLILEKAASHHRQIKIFFANLHAFSSFFSKSPKRIAILDKFIKVRNSAPTTCDFITRPVDTVYSYKTDLINCLETILITEDDYNNIHQAGALLTHLRDEIFEYWLNFFHLITNEVDNLLNQLQMEDVDATSIKTFITTFKNNIQQIRSDILLKLTGSSTPSSSKRKHDSADNTILNRRIAIEICDIILSEIVHRFGNSNHLNVVQLFEAAKFPDYKQSFPNIYFEAVRKSYPKINKSKLKSELEVIYCREEFANSSGALAILQLFLYMKLNETFSESIKLLDFICTIPMITDESERRFSTLKKIKTFISNTMAQSKLTALTMLSIERSLVLSIENFNDQVIDHFANNKDRSIALKFKEV